MSTTDIQEQTVTVNDVELHFAQAGERTLPALLLIHGLYDRWESWDSTIRAFAAHYHVIAPDLRGHGRSTHPKSQYAPQDYALDLIALLDHLEVDQAVPVGHSLGALVAQFLAADYPDRVRALVLIDPPFEQDESSREGMNILLEAKRGTYEETFNTVSEMNWMIDDENELHRETEWLRATADGPFEWIIETIDTGRTAQFYEVLRRVTCPTLLLQADPDSGGILSDAGATMAEDHLQDCFRQKFDSTGHSIHLQRPDDFVEVVGNFLDRSL